MTSKRSLTDELHSVLLARAMEAPEPDEVVRRVLARTVGEVAAVPAGRSRALPAGRSLVAAAAVVVAVLGVGGAAVALHGRASRTTESSRAAADAQRPAATTGQPGVGSLLPAGPQAQAGSSSGVPLSGAALAGALDCSALPGSQAEVGSSVPVAVAGPPLAAYDLRCVAPDGRRSASTVAVYAVSAGVPVQRAVLVAPGAGESVAQLSAGPGRVTVRALTSTGTLVSQEFAVRPDGSGYPLGTSPLAGPCRVGELSVSLAALPDTRGAQALRVANRSAAPCVLTGYPTVVGGVDPGGPAPTPALRGDAGGTRGSVTPIVQLAPGGVAAAVIEASSAHPGCAPSDLLTVTLPGGGTVRLAGVSVSLCGTLVHPFVGNPLGSD
jgi:hypothetical protein